MIRPLRRAHRSDLNPARSDKSLLMSTIECSSRAIVIPLRAWHKYAVHRDVHVIPMKTSPCVAILISASLVSAEQLAIVPEPGNSLHLYVEKTGLLSGKQHDFTFESYSGHVMSEPAQSRSRFSLQALCAGTRGSAPKI